MLMPGAWGRVWSILAMWPNVAKHPFCLGGAQSYHSSFSFIKQKRRPGACTMCSWF